MPVPTRRSRRAGHLRVGFHGPHRAGHPPFKDPIDVWVVYAREDHTPDGVEAIEWMLLTSEAVITVRDAEGRMDWYGLRWIIEEFHKVKRRVVVWNGFN
jgi:hypothetical protein